MANLLDNAVKFSPPGSTCTLRLGRADGTISASVTDEGPGIPVSERADVLKRFYRSERSRSAEGNGPGLALVAAIVRLHGFALRMGWKSRLPCRHLGAVGPDRDDDGE